MKPDYKKLEIACELLHQIPGDHFQRFIDFIYYIIEDKIDILYRLYFEDKNHQVLCDMEFKSMDDMIETIKAYIPETIDSRIKKLEHTVSYLMHTIKLELPKT